MCGGPHRFERNTRLSNPPAKGPSQQAQVVKHGGQRLLRYRFQHDGKKPRCAGEVPFPHRMARRIAQGRVENAFNFAPPRSH